MRPTFTRREWLATSALGLGTVASAHTTSQAESSFHYDHILGTSLDVWLIAEKAENAERAESAMLAEIERLRKVFSLYDSESELSRWNRTEGWFTISQDMAAVLRQYEVVKRITDGACSPSVGACVEFWQQAERTGVLPSAEELAESVRENSAWIQSGRRVYREGRHPLNLNSVAKGYIIQRAMEAVRDFIPSGLINLGGDMTAWGDHTWNIGIQNPENPAENAPPLATFPLKNASVATSGGYQRFYTVAGQRYSHLIDPRTGQPAGGVLSATVIAPESMWANPLATALCVMTPEELQNKPGIEWTIVTSSGEVLRSPKMPWIPVPKLLPIQAKPAAWPAEYEVRIAVELPKVDNTPRYRRPYVSVWIEDAAGKHLRTLSVWGNAPRYLATLNDWWVFGKNDNDLVKAVTRATRAPGKYDLVWDGKDQKGTALGQGTYVVKVEVHREHGKHLRQSGKIECLAKDASVKLPKNDETGETVVEFGKKKKA
jgi:thiamine biosynthesis lipoprotein ApbE